MANPVSYTLVDDIGVITIDNPPVNALSHAVRSGLLEAIETAGQDDSRAVVIHCEGRTFIAGADITEFGKPPADPWLPQVVDAIEACPKVVVAALHGTALGGGFEVALGSHYRIALESARVGLPEVKLGLLPGAGGTQRTPRLAGVKASLDLMTSGAPVPAAMALEVGLIDRIVGDDLQSAALDYARELADAGAECRRTSALESPAHDAELFAAARAELAKRAAGQLAPLKIVDCVEAACQMPFAEGSAVEREAFMECMASPQSAGLRHMFFAERAAGRVDDLPKDTALRDILKVGVIGAGTMGSGIAMNFANAGLEVSLLEVNEDALERGLTAIDRNYAGGVRRGKMTETQARETRARITGTTDYASLADADLIVEAVFENLDLKKDIFKTLDGIAKPGAILATNTSYQDVNEIGAATGRPEDVIGLHFFSPAHIMKLLEVVRADRTADDVLATCMKLAKAIRKIPVVSGVCYG
ncbi:MAG: 3-hydroxyacyl-CoA dehydrogenase NAD-binding domain-containing protein, partial [Pseudomonadota bacterium]